ncbi:MAG: alpha/beta hydrolase [Legionellaceae bacterium]|nr:alpha/beta hydrolase [Legionellaceae bacterium]
MVTNGLSVLTDRLYSWLAYQLFVTPMRLKPPSQYHDSAHLAQEWFYRNRSERMVCETPREHVVHYFSPAANANGKKVLITHGWMSCAIWMSKLIHDFQKAGYEVYALDFPAHGESKGLQITWEDAVRVIHASLNRFGPFWAAVGHSFGGSMLINTMNLSGQLAEFALERPLERLVVLASPTRMRTPVYQLAKRFRFSGSAYRYFRQTILSKTAVDPQRLRLQYLLKQQLCLKWLCVHGAEDTVVAPRESEVFCEMIEGSELLLFPDLNHLTVILDERVTAALLQFMQD